MKTLIMLSAFPASGKSTWANKYKATHDNVVILNSDDIRMEITHGDYQDHSHQKEVWELFEKRIHEYAKEGTTVILFWYLWLPASCSQCQANNPVETISTPFARKILT